METINLGLNDTSFNSDLRDLTQLCKKVLVLKTDISKIAGIELTQSTFEDVLIGECALASKELKKAFESDLKSVRLIAGQEIVKRQYEQTKLQLHDLASKYSELKRLLDFGSVSNAGEFVFNEGYSDKLKQEHTKILTDPKQVELYNAKKEALEAFNRFRDLIHPDNKFKPRPDLCLAHLVSKDTALNWKLLANGIGV